ncbi:MAG: RHS repeat-associated core domain-containing protein [Marinobacter sp.]|uniref:RHS repeat domain-containing protein n=1 Tax=Marinobacter sp. TaxID=50741 RepID=UPI00396E113C
MGYASPWACKCPKNTSASTPGFSPNRSPNPKRKGWIAFQKDQYTYHPDHLGTSAYITHTNGQVYQHLEYFPFGETWVEEHSNKQRTPYLFTAKELDEESQLYYFGARYYDPRTSVWQSADPILADYLGSNESKLTNGGVFESRNLGLFTYSFNSPVVMYDPDGNFTVVAQRKRDGITGKESWSFQFESDGVQKGVIKSAMAKTNKIGKKVDKTGKLGDFLVGKPVGYKHDGLVDRIGKFFRENDVDAEVFSGKEELLGGLVSQEDAENFIENMNPELKEEWGYGDILDRAKDASEDAVMGTSGGLFDKFLDTKQKQWENNPDAM